MIRPISRLEKEAFCKVMVAAFQNDPLFQKAFADTTTRATNMSKFLTFMFAKAFICKERLIGYYSSNQLAAAYSLQTPARVTFWQNLRLIRRIGTLAFRIPLSSLRFLNDYMRLTSSVRPREPHCYLSMIGVHPDAQGQGIGKQLLLNILQEVDTNTHSFGIGLDTENPDNIALYERFGFRLVDTKCLEGMNIYCMFRTKMRLS